MLRGDRVGLRAIEERDLPLMVRWRNDPRTRPMFYTPFLISVTGQTRWYEALSKDPTREYFIMVRLDDSVPIGAIGLHLIDEHNRDAHAGPIMVDPAERGHSLGADAVTTLLRYAFEDLDLRRLYFELLAGNLATQRLAAKLGLRREAVARKAVFVNGRFHDVVHMALLREEWQAHGARDGGRA